MRGRSKASERDSSLHETLQEGREGPQKKTMILVSLRGSVFEMTFIVPNSL